MQKLNVIKKTRVEFRPFFNKQRKKAPLEIKQAFREVLALFLEDSDHKFLRNHPLKKNLAGYRSIDVTEDYRAVFKIRNTKTETIIVFHLLGTHAQLYKK